MDDCFWEELAEMDPDDACRRSGAVREGESYLIRVLGRDYLLSPSGRQLRRKGADQGDEEGVDDSTICFAVVHYLLNARGIPQSDDLVTAADLKGGKLFFAAGAHSPDFSALEEAFAASPQAVQRAAATLGGRAVAHGDAAVEIPALPRLPITFVFWRADEDFSASTSMLFDRTADRQLPLDVILSLSQETLRRLVEQVREG